MLWKVADCSWKYTSDASKNISHITCDQFFKEFPYIIAASCVYKGVEYIPGESWDDGCDYTCTCIGNDVGLYKCVSK